MCLRCASLQGAKENIFVIVAPKCSFFFKVESIKATTNLDGHRMPFFFLKNKQKNPWHSLSYAKLATQVNFAQENVSDVRYSFLYVIYLTK